MTVDVSVDGHPWKVGIEPAERPGQFAVTVKGKRRVIDASWIDAEISTRFRFTSRST